MASFITEQRLVEKLINEQISLNSQYLTALRENSFANVKEELYAKKNKINTILKKWMDLKMTGGGNNNPTRIYRIDITDLINRIEHLYVLAEHIATNEANAFSNAGKGNLRKMRSELQRIRLLLYDIIETKPEKNGSN